MRADVVERACQRAAEARAGATGPTAVAPATRRFAIGDPQASTERFLGALAAHDLLGDDGWLAPDARLVSMGDHFDYAVAKRDAARIHGVEILAWLAAHPPEQVAILAGNHDLCRVMEWSSIDDARFAAAADLGNRVLALPRGERAEATAEFRSAYPDVATPGFAARDYNAFTVEQRVLVQRLLLAARMHLALCVHTLDGTPALATHAGVTHVQLAHLGLDASSSDASSSTDATAIAEALQARFTAAIAAVADDWRAGRVAPLLLAPLYVAGAGGREAGGMLYHRPADLERPEADPSWERGEGVGPRRYDPRELPRGLVQIVGHTGRRKARSELRRYLAADDIEDRPGGLHTLRVSGGDVTYRRGIQRGEPGDAVVWMTDPEMERVPRPADVALLQLGHAGC